MGYNKLMVNEDFGSRRDRVVVHNDNSNKMWIILGSLLVLGAIIAGAFYFFTREPEEEEETDVTVTTTTFPTDEPTPTEVEVDRSEYSIEVLNGSETEGEAGRLQEELESEGFTVDAIANADNSDYTTTIIQAKSDVSEAFLDELRDILEGTFVLGSAEVLDETDENDVVIIIGMEPESEDEASDEAEITEVPEEDPTPTEEAL